MGYITFTFLLAGEKVGLSYKFVYPFSQYDLRVYDKSGLIIYLIPHVFIYIVIK